MAVGWFYNGTGKVPFAEWWNGKISSIVPSPNQGSVDFDSNYFTTVSCSTPSSCMAAGTSENGLRNLQYSFVELWNGTAWWYAPSPIAPAADFNTSITGLSCSHPSSCTVVGYADNHEAGGDQYWLHLRILERCCLVHRAEPQLEWECQSGRTHRHLLLGGPQMYCCRVFGHWRRLPDARRILERCCLVDRA